VLAATFSKRTSPVPVTACGVLHGVMAWLAEGYGGIVEQAMVATYALLRYPLGVTNFEAIS